MQTSARSKIAFARLLKNTFRAEREREREREILVLKRVSNRSRYILAFNVL